MSEAKLKKNYSKKELLNFKEMAVNEITEWQSFLSEVENKLKNKGRKTSKKMK